LEKISRKKAEQLFNQKTPDRGEIIQSIDDLNVIFKLSENNSLIVKFNFQKGDKSYYLEK
jgi:hypothetical protein